VASWLAGLEAASTLSFNQMVSFPCVGAVFLPPHKYIKTPGVAGRACACVSDPLAKAKDNARNRVTWRSMVVKRPARLNQDRSSSISYHPP